MYNIESATNIDPKRCINHIPAINAPLQLIDHAIQRPLGFNPENKLVYAGSKSRYPELEACFVNDAKQTCEEPSPGCTEGGVNYRIRVHSPIPGYLKVNADKEIEVIPWNDYSSASVFQVHPIDDATSIIETSDHLVITIKGFNQPVSMDDYNPKTPKSSQGFHIVPYKAFAGYYYGEEDMYQ
ncbi:hypothetical protein BGX34_007633 [Mortierella sp. NVP85]|nr:hypothetical protein BGX34_007633 [Mortierella sp. NVP85]